MGRTPTAACGPPRRSFLGTTRYGKNHYGVEEDWDSAQDIFQGLTAQQQQGYGTTKGDSSLLFTYGLFEGNNVHFQQNIDKLSKQFS
mmetsp:Transcript_16132/g.24372  ORF Transcript_16132/g.24372 Transcript_16132/m.24372 type:complete len:87 (+) Transcript_16132:123-383(+)